MNKELYIEGQHVELEGSGPIKRTYQANDLTKPDKVQASFSNTFEVLATRETRQLFGYADQVSSASRAPYKNLDATLLSEGLEEVPYATCELLGYGGGKFRLQIFSGNLDFFDRLGSKSLQDLYLPELHHVWDYDTVKNNTANSHYSKGFVYDLVNRGTFSSLEDVYWADLYPSTYGRYLLEAIIKEAGFSGILPQNPLLDRLLIPVSKKYTYPEEFTEAREFRVGTTANNRKIEGTTSGNGELIPFNSADEDMGFSVGSSGNYQLNNYRYVVDRPCFMSFTAGLDVQLKGTTIGNAVGILSIRVNGDEKAFGKMETEAPAPFDPSNAKREYLSCSTAELMLQAGDRVEVYFRLEKKGVTVVGAGAELLYRNGQPASFSGNVSNRFPQGGLIELEKWLPDISQKDFFKFCLNLIGGMVQTDSYTETITVTEMRQVETNQSRARDWSEKLVGLASGLESGEFRFQDFGQKNFIRWKEDNAVPDGYGDEYLLCNNQNLEATKDIIKLPFAASETYRGLVSLPMFNAPEGITPFMLRALVWKVAVASRDNLDDYSDPLDGWTALVLDEDLFYRYNVWSNQWEPLKFSENNVQPRATIQSTRSHGFNLTDRAGASTPVSGLVSIFAEQGNPIELHGRNWVPVHYSTLEGMLTDTRLITREFRLRTADVAGFDFAVPVWLKQYGHFFYVNKIKEYTEGEITSVELIRL